MVDVVPSGISTTSYATVGGTTYGRVDTAGDVDMYRVYLNAGNYHINLGGDPNFGSGLSDTLLKVYNSGGNQLATDDDNGAGSSSYIDFNAPTSGTYYISAAAYHTYTGDYALSLSPDTREVGRFQDPPLQPGMSITGRADPYWEYDIYQIYLVAGINYTFSLESQPGIDNTNSDPITPLGNKVLSVSGPDDYHNSANSVGTASVSFTATATDYYEVEVYGYAQTDHGHYSLSVSSNAPVTEHRPAGLDNTLTIQEDVSHSFSYWDFVFSDADGDGMAAIIVTSLPTTGAFTLGGRQVLVGEVAPASSLSSLRWTPAANANGTGIASFSYVVVDASSRRAADLTPNTITFNVSAVNDAPVITSGGGQASAAVELSENGAFVTTIKASDVDSAPSYGLAGADASLFDINSATGVLTFRAAPDYEAGDNLHDITVIATDGVITDTQTLQVFVRNVTGNTIIGTGGNNTVDAAHAIDSKAATGEEDHIDGKGGHDKLNGLGGNDTLIGGRGNDSLTGGAGFDRLDGGRDGDRFVFSAKLAVAGVDTIVKFEHDKDKLALEDKVFKAIGSSLSADEFYAKAGAVKAHDKSDRIVYNKTTGDLYYDKDGKGGAAAIHFATLSNKPAGLDHGDFLIV
jgi:Ca2+-binding RTX toxin-like protein